jgi:L-fuconolactonase
MPPSARPERLGERVHGRLTRRVFVSSMPLVPFAAQALLAQTGQPETPAFPIIDTHIHIFDKTRPEGASYPRSVPGGGEPPQGMVALPNRYKAIVASFGVVGAIIVEASPRVEDNYWLLDVVASHPIIVGLVGRLSPADAGFPGHLEKLVNNRLFLGIRQGQLHAGLDDSSYIANLKRLADADCSLDYDAPRQGMTATEVLVKALDKVPSLRVVIDHLPDVRFPDEAAKATYVKHLRELGTRPHVYIKLSEVVRRYEGRVSTDMHHYRSWLDELWDIFGEDRIMFGSDWPQSEELEFNSFPNAFNVARNYVRSKNPTAMEKVFWKNSRKPYRWVQREPSQRQI